MNQTRVIVGALAAIVLAGGIWWTVNAFTPAMPGLTIAAFPPGQRDGYQRSCTPNAACVFGPAWTDDTTGTPWSRNGCDTRSNLLQRDLTDVETVQFSSGVENS